MKVPADIRTALEAAGQVHLIHFWEEIDENEQHMLLEQIKKLDFNVMNELYTNAMDSLANGTDKLDDKMQAIPQTQFESKLTASEENLAIYSDRGLKAISEGQVGVVLMAGGQGTRLGVTYPKGMYSVGLPSNKSLFQLQAERIRKIEQLARDKYPETNGEITWYIMTSGPTVKATESYLLDNKYFGLDAKNIVIFQQGLLPSFNFEGKIFLEDKHRISMSPDGNGGIYRALRANGILENMQKKNIQYIHCHSVDNILVKVADPVFIGYCVEKGADCGAKVLPKSSPTEAVGVVCLVDGRFQVVEYSEITSQTAHRRNDDGRLTFDAGNICNHFFTVPFLVRVCTEHEHELKLHVAKKKIGHVAPVSNTTSTTNSGPNGIKVEKFVFDVFAYSGHFVTWQVDRDEEFSPVKNSDTAGSDCPVTARRALTKYHKTCLLRAGGKLVEDGVEETVVEISPLVSYGGEGLVELVAGRTFQSPVYLSAPGERYLSNNSKNSI